MAFLQYGGAGTPPTGAWIVAPSVPEWQQVPGHAFAQVQDSTPPTFVSSGLNSVTGVLTITFSEEIDATPATNVVPTKIHIRESGSYTGGITLTAGELGTAADGTTISFTLTAPHLTAVAGLTTPELTIEPGAVQDTSGNPIDGTFEVTTAVFVPPPFDIEPQENGPRGMAFSNDGTKMLRGRYYRRPHTPIRRCLPPLMSPLPPSGHPLLTSSGQETTPTGRGILKRRHQDVRSRFCKANDINPYELATAFDISTATFVSPSFWHLSTGKLVYRA